MAPWSHPWVVILSTAHGHDTQGTVLTSTGLSVQGWKAVEASSWRQWTGPYTSHFTLLQNPKVTVKIFFFKSEIHKDDKPGREAYSSTVWEMTCNKWGNLAAWGMLRHKLKNWNASNPVFTSKSYESLGMGPLHNARSKVRAEASIGRPG